MELNIFDDRPTNIRLKGFQFMSKLYFSRPCELRTAANGGEHGLTIRRYLANVWASAKASYEMSENLLFHWAG